MSDTKEFDVIRIARSDGADTGPGYWPTISTASKKIAGKDATTSDKTPRMKPQMTRLAEDDPRFIEWRIKLGILLKQELSPNPEEGNPWYAQFPRGYWLYEKSKHLWVSGYPIKAKLYKSPQEFCVHLIWLLSASMDYKDCCCVHCNQPSQAKLAAATEELIITQSETPVPVPMPTATPTTKSNSNTPTPAPATAVPQKVTPVPLPPIPGQRATPPTTAAVLANNSPTPKPPTLPKSSSRQATAAPSMQSSSSFPVPQAQPPQSQSQSQSQAQPYSQPQSHLQPQSQPRPQPQPQPQPQSQAQLQPQS
ncbi:hypothetical protein E4U53_006966, partial [Claviceps sorghi]